MDYTQYDSISNLTKVIPLTIPTYYETFHLMSTRIRKSQAQKPFIVIYLHRYNRKLFL